MKMSISQPSPHMVILTPLDREAINWWHGNVEGSTEWNYPYHLKPHQASNVMAGFRKEGGEVVGC